MTTEKKNEDELIIDGQYIGRLKGLKLELDLKSGSLKTDIKSLRKAARQAISPELMKRVSKIIKEKEFNLGNDHKLYWMENPIAYLSKGKNYLNPKLEIIADEAIDLESKERLKENLEKQLHSRISTQLSDLVNLSNSKFKSNYVRALCYQLFENNGVIKREDIHEMIKKISKEDRTNLRKAGIKIGRYHIFLPRMLKPGSVDLRIKLWKLYYEEDKNHIIPKSGLNFLKDETKKNSKFLLICGFESFNKYYVRVDILERLFLKILENTTNGTFKIDSNMINLVGCSKENFYKLLELMNYKLKNAKDNQDLFIYKPKFQKKLNKKRKDKINKDSPFEKLSELSFT